MKKTILLFLLLVVGLTSIAQSRRFRDVVYLNDSSSIKGRIHFEGPDSTLFVDTPYGCTFAYTKDKVQRYELESQKPFQRHKGFVLQSSMAVGSTYLDKLKIGFGDVSFIGDVSFGFMYRFGYIYSVGLGVSCLLYNNYYSNHYNLYFHNTPEINNEYNNCFSIYIDQRIYFSRKPISPFLEIKTGLPCVSQRVSLVYYYDNSRLPFYGELDAGLSIRDIDIAFCIGGFTKAPSFRFQSSGYDTGFRLGFSFPIN